MDENTHRRIPFILSYVLIDFHISIPTMNAYPYDSKKYINEWKALPQ